MAYNFNRVYELYIGTPSVEKGVFFTNTPKETTVRNQFERYYTDIVPSKAVKITDLQIQVDITRTSKGDSANTDATSFKIFNMSEASRKYAEQEGALIILKAGYKDSGELPVLYAGQIKSVSTEKQRVDVITQIVAGDAYIPQKNARISKYYPPSTSKAAILKDLALSMQGVGEGVFALDALESSYFNSGYSANGLITDIVSKMCKSLGYEYVIENNRVYMHPKQIDSESPEYKKLSAKALEFSSNQIKKGSGKMNDNTKDLSNQESTKAGYKFKIFLDGRVKGASYVRVKDGTLQGVYKVISVRHLLDWRGDVWDTEIETEGVV